MAASDRIVGRNLVVVFLPDGGVAPGDNITLNADATSFSFNRTIDTVDVTAGNETARYHQATIEDADFSLTMFDAAQTYKADILPGASGKLTIYNNGNSTGKEVMSFNALFTTYNEEFPFDGALEIEINGVRRGAMIDEVGTLVP